MGINVITGGESLLFHRHVVFIVFVFEFLLASLFLEFLLVFFLLNIEQVIHLGELLVVFELSTLDLAFGSRDLDVLVVLYVFLLGLVSMLALYLIDLLALLDGLALEFVIDNGLGSFSTSAMAFFVDAIIRFSLTLSLIEGCSLIFKRFRVFSNLLVTISLSDFVAFIVILKRSYCDEFEPISFKRVPTTRFDLVGQFLFQGLIAIQVLAIVFRKR
ncbi:hypothetical protein [Natronosalvus rutilus]|uniref:Uncharacterized protein n=1 Tax=Natronosalvus rutilus TaxID=2953753 RepID=A0A9E7NBG2_9EURY|nr:hypothetical protein [Natronosalvus rutilus]UTF54825.1 hypothetical protein NGM29_06050 [Natronosalvus rutilus]